MSFKKSLVSPVTVVAMMRNGWKCVQKEAVQPVAPETAAQSPWRTIEKALFYRSTCLI